VENNWRDKTLESLEKDPWSPHDSDSRLIRRAKELRKIPLNTFETEDLRMMIGQQLSLDYLIPLALDTLKVYLFAAGDFFEGDLLKNVLSIETGFWDSHKDDWQTLHDLIKDSRSEIAAKKFDTTLFDNCKHNK
jgi:hypothetical protein